MARQKDLDQTYLTRAESAAYIRRSIRFIDYRVANGEIRAFRLGRKLLFLRSDLDEYVQRHCVASSLDQLVEEVIKGVTE